MARPHHILVLLDEHWEEGGNVAWMLVRSFSFGVTAQNCSVVGKDCSILRRIALLLVQNRKEKQKPTRSDETNICGCRLLVDFGAALFHDISYSSCV